MINIELQPLARPLASLHADPRNSRKHPRRSLEALKVTLVDHGQQKPLVVTRDGLILAGNGTYLAARALGWTELACVTFAGTEAEARAYQVADNRSAELAEWDPEQLSVEVSALLAAGVTVEQLGFNADELTLLLNSEAWTPPAVDDAFYFNPYVFTKPQWAIIAPVLTAVKAVAGDPGLTDGRALELLAADYLAG